MSYITYWQEQAAQAMQRIITQHRALCTAAGFKLSLPACLAAAAASDDADADITRPPASIKEGMTPEQALSLLPFPPLPASAGLSLGPGQELEVSFDELARICHIQTLDLQDTLKEHHVLCWDKGRWVFSWSNLEAYWRGLRDRRRRVAAKEAALRAEGRAPPPRISVRPAIASKIHWVSWQPVPRQQLSRGRITEDPVAVAAATLATMAGNNGHHHG